MKQVGRTLIEKALQLVDVVVHYGHQTTRRLLRVPLHLEILDVGVSRHSQFMLRGLCQIAPQNSVEVLEHRLQHPDDHSDACEYVQLVVDVRVPHLGEERVLTGGNDIDGHTNQYGWS